MSCQYCGGNEVHFEYCPTPQIKGEIRLKRENRVSTQNPTDIDNTLKERGARYGRFIDHARTTQQLKAVMFGSSKWSVLQHDQREALEMLAHKIGRILEGDPDYHDSWHDIVGYAKLVADRLEGRII